jgi:hypothetical protein
MIELVEEWESTLDTTSRNFDASLVASCKTSTHALLEVIAAMTHVNEFMAVFHGATRSTEACSHARHHAVGYFTNAHSGMPRSILIPLT